MQTSVTFISLDPSETLKAYACEKLDRFDKYVGNPAKANVVLTVEKFRHIADINISGDGFVANGHEETADMYSAIDMALDKLEKQIIKNKKKFKRLLKKTWYFIWEDDSIWSWIVNIILAFVLIKFIVYPGLGFLLSTSHPVVAVVSDSMEHNMEFNKWWEKNERWYLENGIDKEEFEKFPLKNG